MPRPSVPSPRRWVAAVVSVAASAAGCGGDGGDADASRAVDAATGPVFRFQLPTLVLPPGVERTACYYLEADLGPDVAVQRWESDITSGAHGLRVFASTDPILPAGTLTDTCVFQGAAPTQLARWLYEASRAHDESDLPPGVAMPLAAHQPLIVRLHVVNPSDQPQTIESEVRLIAAEPGRPFTPAAVYTSYRTDIHLDPDVVTTVTGACPVPAGLGFFRLSALSLSQSNFAAVTDDSGPLFRTDDPTHPGSAVWLQTPHVMAGPMRYSCRYLNATGRVVTAGGVDGLDELCVVIGHIAPATADVRCVDDALVAP